MSQTIHMLRAIVSSKVDSFVAGIQKAGSITRDLAGAWTDSARSIERSASRVGLAVGASLAGISAATTKVGFSFLSMKQQAEISFGTMLGSAAAAKAMVRDLADFAAKTPFELAGLLKSSQMLMAFGFQAKQIIPLMRAVGDAVSGLGGSPEQMNQVIRALGQIKAKGKASAEEMLQLAEVGIPAWQMLADKIGVSIPEAMKLVERGAVNAETTIAAVVDGMNARFGGMMVAQSRTFSGMLSTLRDNFAQSAAFVVEPLFDAVTRLLAKVNTGFEGGQFGTLLGQLRAGVQQLVATAESGGPKIAALWQRATEFATGSLPGLIEGTFAWGRKVIEAADALRPFGDAFLWAAKAAGELVARNPELALLFGILKVSSLLGITEAVGSLGRALLMTGQVAIPAVISGAKTLGPLLAGSLLAGFRALGTYLTVTLIPQMLAWGSILLDKLIPALQGLTTNVGLLSAGLKAIGFAALAVAMFKAADAMGIFGRNVEDANRTLALQNTLLTQRAKLLGDRGSEVAAQASKIADVGQRKRFLEDQLAQAERVAKREDELAVRTGREAQAAADRQFGIGKAWTEIATLGEGETDADFKARQAQQAKQTAEAAQRSVQAIRDELAAIPAFTPATDAVRETTRQAADDLQQAAPAIGAAIGDHAAAALGVSGAGGGAKEQPTPADVLAERQQQALEKQLPGVGGLSDFMKLPGVTPDQVSQFAGMMPGVSAAQAGSLGNAFGAMGPGADPAQIDALAQRFVAAVQAAGQAMEAAAARAETSKSTLGEFAANLTRVRDEGLVGAQWADQMATKAAALGEQFNAGQISAAQFTEGMRALSSEVNTAAAVNQAMGSLDGTLKKLQGSGQLSAQGVAFFNQQMNVLHQMFQAGKISLDQFTGALKTLQQQASKGVGGGMGGGFGGMMGGMMGNLPPFLQQIFQMGFGGGQPVQLGTPGEWFQKAAQANVRNMGGQDGGGGGGGAVPVTLEPTPLQRLASAVGERLQRSGPFVEEFDRVATNLVGAVNAGRIADMNVPVGSPRATAGATNDGGMGTQIGAAQVSLEFPNLTRVTNADLRQIVDGIELELARRGRSV